MSDFINLQQAVVSGSKEKILKLLLNEDVDVKSSDEKGDTLMHLAFRNQAFGEKDLCDVLQIILDRGNDINVKNKLGKTILHLAVDRQMRDVVDFCLRRNANTNPKHKRRNSIAHFAIEKICRKFPIGSENTEAFQHETSSFVDWMVSRGFDFFYAKNINDFNPLYLANYLNVQHILLTLLKRVSDLSKVENVQTPLLIAFLEKNYDSNPIFNGWFKALNSIHPWHYGSRYVYDVVKIILEKSRRVDDKTLDLALRLVIKNQEEMYVVDLLAQRIKNVDESLIELFSKSFKVTSTDWNAKDKMAILKCLVAKGINANERRRGEQRTLAERLFLRHPTLEMLRILKDARADFNLYSSNPQDNFLYLISCHGRGAGLIDFVASEGSVNIANSKGETPLITAIMYGNEDAARELIEHGAEIHVTHNNSGKSALLLACEMGQARVVEKMIEHGVDLRYRNENGRTLLHLSLDHPKVLELLLKNGLYVNARDNCGKTPLYLAMTVKIVGNNSPLAVAFEAGQIQVLQRLIEHGAELKYKDKDGKTLLHLAVKYAEVIELLLLKSGLDVNAKDNSGRTALEMAREMGRFRVQEKLIRYGADLDYTDEHNRTLLHLAVHHVDLVDVLLKRGLNVNAKDSSGKTPLVMACEVGQVQVQEKLLEHGADLDYKDEDNKTLLHLAVGHPKVSERLLNSGLDVNAKDRSGKSPLHWAKTDQVVRCLFGAGARVDALDNAGNTPLYDALSRNVYSIEGLISCGANVQDPKVFQLALEHFEHPYTNDLPMKLRYLKRHLLKMSAVGLLTEMPRTRNGLEDELQLYYERYQAEVETLKMYFIDDCTSLCDLLHKDPNCRCAYVDNERLKSFLKDADNIKKFCNYFALIENCYNEAASRKSLSKLTNGILSQLGKINLPNSCTHLIFVHLSNVDLVRLIQVYEDSDRSKSANKFTNSSNNLLPIVKLKRI